MDSTNQPQKSTKAVTSALTHNDFRPASSLFVLTFAIFFFSPVVQISDSKYSMLTAESLAQHGSPDLSGYSIPHYRRDLPPSPIANPHCYQLEFVNGRVLYLYPHGSSWLSAPFVAIASAVGVSPVETDGDYNLRGEVLIQKVLSAFFDGGPDSDVLFDRALDIDMWMERRDVDRMRTWDSGLEHGEPRHVVADLADLSWRMRRISPAEGASGS